MSALRPLLSPLTGVAVAGVVLYSMGSTLSVRTHQLSDSLHFSSRSLRRLAQVDDTEDLLTKANVAPDAATMASSMEQWEEKEKGKLRAAFAHSPRTSLREEIKARWNGHLYSVTSFLSETDVDRVFTATSSTLSTLYKGITGQAMEISDESGKATQLANRAMQKFQSVTSSAAASGSAPATLRTPLPPRHDLRLDMPNTNYIGQGTSLR